MINFAVNVDSSTNKLALHFDELPDALNQNLKAAITHVAHELLVHVKAAEPVRTGRLRAATHAYVDERQDWIRGRVRIIPTGHAQSVGAAFGALEYGAPGKTRSGPVSVKQYTRDGVRVASYDRRRPRIRARRFLRGPAEAMRPQITAELQAAIGQTINEFKFDTLK